MKLWSAVVKPLAASMIEGLRPGKASRRKRTGGGVVAAKKSRSASRSTSNGRRSNGSKSRNAGKRAVSGARSRSQLDTKRLEGREPSHDPDVFIDIRRVAVDEIYVDVEQLEAHLALRAKLANLLQIVAGVHTTWARSKSTSRASRPRRS
jgi:hypothetical protein